MPLQRVLTLALAIAPIFPGWCLPAAAQPCEPAWDYSVGNPGLNSTVWSMCVANVPSAVGPALYVGGQFSSAGGVAAKNIARWNGATWSPLGAGAVNGGTVYAIAVGDDGLLYAGGAFPNMADLAGTRRIAKWNGASWSDVGGGVFELSNAGIRALCFFNGNLYAGGYINEIGGVTAHKLARWDSATWSALPGDPLGSTAVVRALGVYDDGTGPALYVGGEFDLAGGDTRAANVFKWDGTSLEPLGRGVDNAVEALAVFEGQLYVGGQFTQVTQADGTMLVAEKIARWDGSTWHELGSGMGTAGSTHVWALTVFDDGTGEALYAGGSFSNPASRVARYDGGTWSAVGDGGPNGYLYALDTFAHDGEVGLFAAGTFTSHNSNATQRIAEWRGGLPAAPANATAEPADICLGASAELSASVPGAEIDWYTDGCGVTPVGTGAAITVAPTVSTTYYARSRSTATGCESGTCAAVAVSVGTGPTISAQPTGADLCIGDTHEVCVAADGVGELSYQWQRDGQDLEQAIAACYVASETGEYRCIVSDDCDQVVSDVVAITVSTGPAITSQPSGAEVCEGVAHELCVSAEGSGDLTYQWRRNGFLLIGAVDACYSATVAAAYDCLVFDDCGSTVSDPATLAVQSPPPADLNADCVVDLGDYALFHGCLAGPVGGLLPGCANADFDADSDVDLADIARFMTALTP